jgi:S-methylmethionine-dependent homocysteine/selenocysteine methylase
MPTHHAQLPHQSPVPFITDGGLETTLVFLEKLDLPCFAAFPLLNAAEGRETLRRYYRTYAELAVRFGAGFVLESPTWRANPDWAAKLGYSPPALEAVNREAIGLMREIQWEFQTPDTPFIISGCLGPRGDGYQVGAAMPREQAARYHAPQIRTYRDAGADLVTAVTMTYAEEALGIADAAGVLEIPSVISFTVEMDGRLLSGQTLREAIAFVDAKAARAPAYYMINCAHPTHFASELPVGASWLSRIVGLRANASCRSHAELDASPDLDAGDPAELGEQYRKLRELLPRLNVLGGCCGTDHRHIEAICECCLRRREGLTLTATP